MGMINLLNGDTQAKPENVQPTPQPEPAQAQPPENANEQPEGESGAEEQKFAGRFNSVEELERGYEQLNSQQGKAGNELGTLQTQIAEQNRQMSEMIANQNQQAQQAQQQQPVRDLESERMTIGSQMDNGDISIPEGLAQLRKIDALENQDAMSGQIQEMQANFTQELEARDQDAQATRFHEQNPEFAQMQQQGVFEQIKANNEFINDDFQAFLAHKSEQEYIRGKDEAATEIKGSAPAGDVASNAGSQMRTEQPVAPVGRQTDADNLSSGLAALEKAGFNQMR